MTTTTVERGFRSPEVCRIAGITYRQLDHWTRTGRIVPSILGANGSGSARLYSRADVAAFMLCAALCRAGLLAQQAARAAGTAAEWGILERVMPGDPVLVARGGAYVRVLADPADLLLARDAGSCVVVWPRWELLYPDLAP